jgi:phage gp29-like protein
MSARPEIGREIATTADGIDITRGYVGPLLMPYDSVLRNRGGGDLTIYEQVFSDPEVKATFAQRQLAVTSCEWQVDAGGDRPIDQEAADALRENLTRIGWDNITTKMLHGVFYGYAVAELIYGVDAKRVVIERVKVRNRRRFRFGKDGDLRLLTMQQMYEGVPAPQPYFWSFATGADHDDEPYGLGLAHWLYWPVLFKRNGLKFWLIFLEKFGAPTAVGRYNAGSATAAEKTALLQAVRAIQTDSGIIIPEGMAIELLEAARSGTSDYAALQTAMDAAIQKVVLGQTASTQGTPGRLGGDDLQGDVRDDIIKADADLICESFNLGPARWLTEWNFPGAAVPRVYRVTEEPEDLTARAERDTKVAGLGFKPSLAYVRETYGGEWTEKAAPEPLEPDARDAPGDSPEFAEARTPANTPAEGWPTDAPGRQAEQLGRRLDPVAQRWIEQIREAVERAGSLEELREGLLRLAPEMTLDEYAAVLAEAMTAATLAGRYEVQAEVAP